jgi:FtsH-binding integral membrane protein
MKPTTTTQSANLISKESTKSFVSNVFSLMFTALIISGLSAIWFSTDGMKEIIMNNHNGVLKLTTIGWIVSLSPLGLVLLMGAGFQKFSVKTLLAIFLIYSTLTGISLSTIFSVYTTSSIASTFFISSLTFGVMALTGYTTKTDLTKMGSFLYMALIGIIIASLINWFMQSEQLDYIISIIGVLVFTGLTAYDVQKIKNIGSQVEQGSKSAQKLMIMGALTLYLDFINLFLMLLRLLGNRD